MNIIESAKSILTRMLNKVSSVWDISEGSFFYDLFSPISIEFSSIKDLLQDIFRNSFADTAEGQYLDRICKTVGVYRKSESPATGIVKVKGTVGATVPVGELVASGLITFKFLENATIPSSGEINVTVECTQSGIIGNVGAGTITSFPKTLEGLTSVTNENDFDNGTDIESDVELRERYYLKVRTPATSGNKYEYIQWARAVNGVGDAKCKPLWNGNGTVKVILVNNDKTPASGATVSAVKTYIEEKRPIGATVTVVAAGETKINVTGTLVLKAGYELQNVKSSIQANIEKYLKESAFSESIISIAKITCVIMSTEGVKDLTNLSVNGQQSNVTVPDDNVATVGTLNFAA